MFYSFDIVKWVRSLLPPILRRNVVLAFVQSLIWPMVYVYELFSLYTQDIRQQLSYNAFTIYLEKFLNGLFGLDHEIYIEDYREEPTIYLAREAEKVQPDYFSRASESADPVYVSNSDLLIGGFYVMVPSSVATEENIALITRWVNYYRFAGTTFSIKKY